ncbi:hypothetical protein AYI70_g787 [Smittium culicis]|uniref:Uncharacterized protein n=1 Tax=Smittium culicis TaxID=133412 RepID=A0A1R1YFE6_9FUNG|nr:hypothetical protein AYI70_g8514 [Smittium culicis]OMJ18435.1 hypothetical protein AYI70_g5359 [Smittium culicis]OMJ25619.1 hypothetical protein AYI70_g787 [Smittium culicis]
MDDRRDELEKKRAKLAELRRAREERRLALINAKSSSASTQENSRSDLDSLVNSLIGSRSSEKPSAPSSIKSPILTEEVPSFEKNASDSKSPSQFPPNSPSSQFSSFLPSSRISESIQSKPPTLKSFTTIVLDLPPKEKVVYNKNVQVSTEPTEQEILELQKNENLLTQQQVQAKITEAIEAENKKRIEEEAERQKLLQAQKESDEKILILNENEQSVVLSNKKFIDFFEKSSKLIERALDEDYDFTVDYSSSAADNL